MKVLARVVVGIALMGLTTLSRADGFAAGHIPMSPQMAEPHDAWVTLVPGIVLAVLSSLIWVFGKKRNH